MKKVVCGVCVTMGPMTSLWVNIFNVCMLYVVCVVCAGV